MLICTLTRNGVEKVAYLCLQLYLDDSETNKFFGFIGETELIAADEKTIRIKHT